MANFDNGGLSHGFIKADWRISVKANRHPPSRSEHLAPAKGPKNVSTTVARFALPVRFPGELLGQQQSGSMRLRFGDLMEDLNLIRQARNGGKNFQPAEA